MKTIGRIFIILAVFALVMGITYVIVNNGPSGSTANAPQLERGQGNFVPNGEQPNFANGQRPQSPGGERNEFRGERGGGVFFGWIKNTAIIAIIVVLIALPKGWLQKRRRTAQVAG